MSHPNHPMYYVLSNIDSYNGNTNVIGIFESMRALSFRLQRVYSTCGDEYHIDCLHLQDAESEAKMLTEEQVNRVKYQREEEIKDQLLKEHEENKKKVIEKVEKDWEEHKEFIGNSNNSDEQLAEEIREERLNVA